VKQSREWLAGAVLAAGGMIFALVMLEVGVRWLHLLPDRFWEPDPVLGARLTPGKTGWWTQEEREFLIPVAINSHGLRDVEHEYEKKPGVARILVLGDSFVEALHVALEDSFPRRLEAELDDDGRDVEVISAGVSGYGTAGAVLFFESQGKRYHPDVVLLAFYPGNDVRNNSALLEDTFRPVYGEDGELQRVESVGSSDGAGRDSWSGRLAAYRYLRKLVLTRQPALAKVLTDLGLMRPEALRQTSENETVPVAYGVYAEPLDRDWEDAWARTEGLLSRLRRDVEQAGAKLMVAALTTREQIYADTWEEILAAHPAMRERRWDLQAPQRRLIEWCESQNVACVALEAAFVGARDGKAEPLHYKHDGHWTPTGHAVAAAALKEFIEGRHLLAPESGGTGQ
jgi:hypothetical protein